MDEQFVKRFCETYGISMSVKQFDTQGYAKKKGISIEMAARELRYTWFEEMRLKKKMDYIVVGHHADDLAETLFINICRGTGIKGLIGIRPVKDRILRPLLSRSREEIIAYIEQNKLGYRTDSTNNSLDYVRNKIRHMIIPVCKDINPSFLNTVRENCNTLKEVEQIYRFGIDRLKEEVISEDNGEILIDIQKTMATPAPYTLLFEILRPYGFNATQIEDILNSYEAIPVNNLKQENTCSLKVEYIGDYSISSKKRTNVPYWQTVENIMLMALYSNSKNTILMTLLPYPEIPTQDVSISIKSVTLSCYGTGPRETGFALLE